jgi:hypothetical protein
MIYLCGLQRTISELVHTRHQEGEHVEKGHLSWGPSHYSAKSLNGFRVNPHSNQDREYDRSTTDTESPKSRYPPGIQHGDLASPHTMAYNPMFPHQQPLRGELQSQDNNFSGYQPITRSADVPSGLRINREAAQYGPHELAGDGRVPQMREQAPPYQYHKR